MKDDFESPMQCVFGPGIPDSVFDLAILEDLSLLEYTQPEMAKNRFVEAFHIRQVGA